MQEAENIYLHNKGTGEEQLSSHSDRHFTSILYSLPSTPILTETFPDFAILLLLEGEEFISIMRVD